MKKFIICLLVILSLGLIGVSAYFGLDYYFDRKNDNAFNSGYEEGIDKNKEYYTGVIQDYEKSVEKYKEDITRLKNNIETLTIEKNVLEQEIENLNGQKEELEANIETLRQENEGNAEKIKDLQNQILTLNSNINQYNMRINRLNEQISSLQSEKQQLEGQLAEKEALLNAIANGEKVIATYVVEDKLYIVKILDKGSPFEDIAVDIEGKVFVGWSLDGSFDKVPEDYIINYNITFYAVKEREVYDVV